MSTLNRRHMLLGLAAASTAAATVSAKAAPAENPTLLALSAELPAIAAAYHEINEGYQATYKEWDAQTPWAPDEITERGTGWPLKVPNQPGDPELRVLGGFLWRVGDDFPRRITIKARHLYWELKEARRTLRKAKKTGSLPDFMAAETEVKRLTELYDRVSGYERRYLDTKAAAKAWHDVAYQEKDIRQEALESHVAAIMREEDWTMEGLIIKAQALAEWDRVGTRYVDKAAFRHGKDWHGQIAASILRHAQGGAATSPT